MGQSIRRRAKGPKRLNQWLTRFCTFEDVEKHILYFLILV
jgi:hypothetical protein